nr:alpha/beta hydrolase [Sphingomonas sp. CDS-1]
MTTRHLVDPEILPLLDILPAIDFSIGLDLIRDQIAQYPLPQTAVAIEPEIRHAPGRGGAPDVPLHLYNPPGSGKGRAALLYMHGGGMVLGSADMARSSLPDLAMAHDAVGVSVEYRLAPETTFPGPQEDCYAALAWLVDHSEELGVDPRRIILLGESAGGAMAAALAIMVRDRGDYSLAGQILTFPMLDHRTGGEKDVWKNPMTGEFVWTGAANQFGWTSMRGDYGADDKRKGWFSPSLADDLSRLPPTFIAVGSLDLFLDENLDYARRLIAAGVPVDLDLYAGAPHAFGLVATADVTRRLRAGVAAAVERFVRRSA